MNMRSERYYDRLNQWSEALESFAESYHSKLTKMGDIFTKGLSQCSDFVLEQLQPINEFLMTHYKKARYLTLPLHWIWILLWAYFQTYDDEDDPTNQEGLHYIQAPVGGGKSTFMWQKMYDYGKMTGRCSYVSTKMEKIKYDEIGTPYLNHIYFTIDEFYGLKHPDDKFGQQLKKFNSALACALVIDELHVLNNNRNNRTSEYNQKFIPMINSFVLQRHFGIKWILVGSQMPKNDTQIMSILTSYNKLNIKKGFVYSEWLKDGRFIRRIKGWTIHSYKVSADNDYLKLDSNKKLFKKATVDFSDFETLNMKDALDDLLTDRREVLV